MQEPVRQKLPRTRNAKTFSFRVADCHGYVTVGEYDDGRPGEMFLKVAKQGSTLAGIMDAFAISVSHGLQYGVPLEAFVEMFTNMRFEPAGMTDDPDIRFATSLVDYIFRRLAVAYLAVRQARGDGHPDGRGAAAADAARCRGSDDAERDVDGPPARRPGAVGRAASAQRQPAPPAAAPHPSRPRVGRWCSATSAATSCSAPAVATPARAAAAPAAARDRYDDDTTTTRRRLRERHRPSRVVIVPRAGRLSR